jgi:hypothetical protein
MLMCHAQHLVTADETLGTLEGLSSEMKQHVNAANESPVSEETT